MGPAATRSPGCGRRRSSSRAARGLHRARPGPRGGARRRSLARSRRPAPPGAAGLRGAARLHRKRGWQRTPATADGRALRHPDDADHVSFFDWDRLDGVAAEPADASDARVDRRAGQPARRRRVGRPRTPLDRRTSPKRSTSSATPTARRFGFLALLDIGDPTGRPPVPDPAVVAARRCVDMHGPVRAGEGVVAPALVDARRGLPGGDGGHQPHRRCTSSRTA